MYLARLTPYQLCRPSNRLHCPEKRLEKLPIGVGVFSLFSAKSAAVKLCCRSSRAEDEHRIVSAHRALGKHDLRHERRAGLANLGEGNVRAGQGGLVQRILFQRHADGLRQCQADGRVLRASGNAETAARVRANPERDDESLANGTCRSATVYLAFAEDILKLRPEQPAATGTISNVVCSSALCFTMAPDRAILLFRKPDGLFDRLR